MILHSKMLKRVVVVCPIRAIAKALQTSPSTIANIIKRGQQCKAKLGRPRKNNRKDGQISICFLKETAFQQMQSQETISNCQRTQSEEKRRFWNEFTGSFDRQTDNNT